MVKINDVIFDNLKEGSLFDFDPTRVELIVGIWGAGFTTIRREKGSENIKTNLYDVFSNSDIEQVDDRKSVSVYRNPRYSNVSINALHSEYRHYRQRLIGARRW